MTRAVHVDVVAVPCCHHGEGPVWDERSQTLLWVDLTADEIHSLEPATGRHATQSVGREIGIAVPRRGGGLALAVREGFATLDAAGRVTVLADPLAPHVRMNDGAVDPEGRFWAGSMAYDAAPGAGSLFRLDADGSLTTVLDGVTISNGLAWDPDARFLYYIDSATGGVDRFDYDRASGAIGRRRRLIDMPFGEPDGMTVDADGCLWVAIWDGGQVRRYDPRGRLLESVEVPVTRPTSCAFGGPALDRLFITTSRLGLDVGDPVAGALLVVDPGVAGLATPPFEG